MTAMIEGLDRVEKLFARYERRLDKERTTIVKKAARQTLVPPMKAEAKKSPGRAAARLIRATGVRTSRGDRNVVKVGPHGGKNRADKSGAWFRAIFVVGHPAEYAIPKNGEMRRRLLYNQGAAFISGRPVTHPAIPSNPFVRVGAERGQAAFVDAVSKAMFSTEEKP